MQHFDGRIPQPVQRWQHLAKLHSSVLREPKERAVGNGAGILLTAATSTGCLLGAAVPQERGRHPEELGQQAAKELLEDLQTGACVDRW